MVAGSNVNERWVWRASGVITKGYLGCMCARMQPSRYMDVITATIIWLFVTSNDDKLSLTPRTTSPPTRLIVLI